jgi:excisionase family DNA binding protein
MSQSEKAQQDCLFTYREAAKLLGVAVGTIYSMVHRRQIPFLRLGRRLVRFSERRLNEWLRERSIEPGASTERHGGER